MPPLTSADLLTKLLKATKPSQVQAILREIGDSPELTVGQTFGNGYRWHFFGNKESNISTINLGTKPGRSLTERLTNAIDAVLEHQMLTREGTVPMPDSPSDAAFNWFGRPPSDANNGLFNWKQRNHYDRKVQVVMLQGDRDTKPTIDIIDAGIGITPDNFYRTILSLQEGNKIKKAYLAGAFGQGGASTFSFSDYTLIVSRHANNPNVIGFTIVRLMKMDRSYKEDAYVYLALESNSDTPLVPSVTFDEPIDLQPSVPDGGKKPTQFEHGTLIRHYGYELSGISGALGPQQGNLYHLFHYMMFDPLIPFRVIDLRTSKQNDQLVSGARNRLMTLSLKTDADDQKGDTGTSVEHHFRREMVNVGGDSTHPVGIEYWVVLSYDSSSGKLRPSSNILFVERHFPILATMNGQNQGQKNAQLLRDLQLTMVAKHIIIHIDASLASSDIRRQLFSSTREGFKDGPVLDEIMDSLSRMIEDDERLHDIERQLEATLIRKEADATDLQVKKEVTKLLQDAGLEVGDIGDGSVKGDDGDPHPAPPPGSHRPFKEPDPLQTLPYPDATFVKIVWPKGKFEIPLQDKRVIRIETDADWRFDREKRLVVRFEPQPQKVAVHSYGTLRGGRMYWRLRATNDAKSGQKGQIIVTLTLPDGRQLVDKIPYEVQPAREEKTKPQKTLVPPFEIVQVNPDTEPEIFASVWDLPETDNRYAVAYKTQFSGGRLVVYYSTGFERYTHQLDNLKKRSNADSLIQLFDIQYRVWVAYHAILQYQRQNELSKIASMDDEDRFQRLQDEERSLVARMQVEQALKTVLSQKGDRFGEESN